MADEKAILARAEKYLMALSQGVDPISGMTTEDSVLDQERLRKCFAFVAAYIHRDLQSAVPTEGMPIFSEEAENRICLNEDVRMADFTKRINEVLVDEGQREIPAKTINNWLLHAGFVDGRVESTFVDRKVLRANERSEEFGIYEKTGISAKTGEFVRTLMFSVEAQHWIVRHLAEMLEELQHLKEQEAEDKT